MRRIFSSENDEPQGSDFEIAIQSTFKDLYPLEDEEIGGVWYANLQALQPLDNSGTELEARFSLSRDRTAKTETDVFNEPLHIPITIRQDLMSRSLKLRRNFSFFSPLLTSYRLLKMFTSLKSLPSRA